PAWAFEEVRGGTDDAGVITHLNLEDVGTVRVYPYAVTVRGRGVVKTKIKRVRSIDAGERVLSADADPEIVVGRNRNVYQFVAVNGRRKPPRTVSGDHRTVGGRREGGRTSRDTIHVR